MMQIQYQKKFLKDLAAITSKSRETIENLVFKTFLEYENVEKSGKLEKLKGYNSYFKIRVGNYRIGLKIENDILYFERVLHRKEIYKFFP
ncbi:MAG: type II toxin-antitoxin system RelE/ParE family toxin [Bacteroidetes bacterium]|nr:type II toxin-antitoxin system RelE/ParE family toxin [Bacteroidota bacterium]MBU1373019.1 type II toxin-antitoxin system RelE/ParE family toxin [Bacteroidota bacterium]MBU1485462.1 type II toxin-antitoxin system RelE/ParE family toxin [Bacteroidota bacterium]MBU1762204.1 type II toxin-antitoxin system RelE/ParE family toxin [Bacteroidota bacterium]MBU2267240.1 type II toxin-antitoxin system RelE/ParE family toxin [Bacteroidota bacterium]